MRYVSKYGKNIIFTLLLLLAILFTFIFVSFLFLHATPSYSWSASVIPDVSLPLMQSSMTRCLKYPLQTGWSPGNNIDTISYPQQLPSYPYQPLEGTYCVGASSEHTDRMAEHTLRYSFPTAQNFSEYPCFFLAIYFPRISDGRTDAELTLFSANGSSFTLSAEVIPDSWNGFYANISGFSGRTAITGYDLTLHHEYSGIEEDRYGAFSFYVDYPALSQYEDAISIYRFMSNLWKFSGVQQVHYSANDHTYTLNVTDTMADTIAETDQLFYNIFSDTNAVALCFSDTTGCQSVRCYYSSDQETGYSVEYSFQREIPESLREASSCTLIFPIKSKYITNLRFVFENSTQPGEITLHSISPACTSESSSDTLGFVDSCVIAGSRNEITVSGTLSAETVAQYAGSRLYLYAIPGGMAASADTLLTMTPIAQTIVSSSYTLKYTPSEENISSALQCRYIVALRKTTTLQPLNHGIFITNPEALSSSSVSPNGIDKAILTERTKAELLGSGFTVIKVPLEQILSLEPTSISFRYAGTLYFFSEEGYEQLEQKIQAAIRCGMDVILQLTVSKTDQTALNQLLIHPDALRTGSAEDAVNRAKYTAFNTESAEGIMAIQASVAFFTQHFCHAEKGNGVLIGWIVGSEVENACSNYYMGEKTLEQFTAQYALALRSVYQAARAICGNIKVYASVGNDLGRTFPAESVLRYDTYAFLREFAFQIRLLGDIDFGISLNPLPKQSDHFMAWEDKLTSEFMYYISQGLFSGRTKTRYILLLASDNQIAPIDSAELLYTGNNLFIYAQMRKYCKGNALFALDSQTNWQTYPMVYRDMDTVKAISTSESFWNTLQSSYPSAAEYLRQITTSLSGASRVISVSSTDNQIPSGIIGEVSLWKWKSGNTDGWISGEYCQTINVQDISDEKDLLVASLLSAENDVWRGIKNIFVYPRDFSRAPYITFDVQLLSLPDNFEQATVSILLKSGIHLFQAVGNLSRHEKWITFTIDLSNFPYASHIDAMEILICGENIGSPTLVIQNIRGMSKQYSSEYLEQTLQEERDRYLAKNKIQIPLRIVYYLSAIGMIALSAEGFRMMLRLRHRRKKPENR